MPYTTEQVRENLRNNNAWLERGILAVYKSNGFGELDSDYLNYLARWIESGKSLNGKHLRRARALMMKYAGQLEEIANTGE